MPPLPPTSKYTPTSPSNSCPFPPSLSPNRHLFGPYNLFHMSSSCHCSTQQHSQRLFTLLTQCCLYPFVSLCTTRLLHPHTLIWRTNRTLSSPSQALESFWVWDVQVTWTLNLILFGSWSCGLAQLFWLGCWLQVFIGVKTVYPYIYILISKLHINPMGLDPQP